MTDPHNTQPDPPVGPYGTAAPLYWQAGWQGVLPLPAHAKKPVPTGYTGQAGGWPSYPDLHAWTTGPEGAGNLALRLPHHLIGLDVDAYDTKTGAATLANLEAKYGPLPPAWRSTSRDDGISGIRLYRVPEGLAWPGDLGGGIEIIQHRHRYMVAWPSVHPTTGKTYRWLNPAGVVVAATTPGVEEHPDLPPTWVQGITGGVAATHTPKNTLDNTTAGAWLLAHGQGAPCRAVTAALARHAADLTTSGASRHDAALRGTQRLTHLAAEGHPGTLAALDALQDIFTRQTSTDTTRVADLGEWARMVAGAINVTTSTDQLPPAGDPCDNPFAALIDNRSTPWQQPYSGPAGSTVPPAPSSATDGSTSASTEPPAPTAGGAGPTADDLTEQAIRRAQLLNQEIERQRATREARRHLDNEDAANLAVHNPTRMVDGATFILDTPDTIPTLWGDGDDVLWAEGESLMLVGPPGVGKTTLAGQLIRARLGLTTTGVLGMTVTPGTHKVLYLAMDRPSQARRALRRHFLDTDREHLTKNLTVWRGPPPTDVAKNPHILTELASFAGADTIVIDSIKDAAVGLTEDEVAAGYNRARQGALEAGIQVLELHHLVKRGANGAKPNTLADVYGSAWLTAGAGSVLLLWGAAGDPIVEMVHLKQPAAEVGPHRVIHDHDTGTSSIWHSTDLLSMAKAAGPTGLTAKSAAAAMFSTDKPTAAEVEKARRKLLTLERGGFLDYEEGSVAAAKPAVWTFTDTFTAPLVYDITSVTPPEGPREALTSTNSETVKVREGVREVPSRTPPPLEGGACGYEENEGHFCRHCGAENTTTPDRAMSNCPHCGRRP